MANQPKTNKSKLHRLNRYLPNITVEYLTIFLVTWGLPLLNSSPAKQFITALILGNGSFALVSWWRNKAEDKDLKTNARNRFREHFIPGVASLFIVKPAMAWWIMPVIIFKGYNLTTITIQASGDICFYTLSAICYSAWVKKIIRLIPRHVRSSRTPSILPPIVTRKTK